MREWALISFHFSDKRSISVLKSFQENQELLIDWKQQKIRTVMIAIIIIIITLQGLRIDEWHLGIEPDTA